MFEVCFLVHLQNALESLFLKLCVERVMGTVFAKFIIYFASVWNNVLFLSASTHHRVTISASAHQFWNAFFKKLLLHLCFESVCLKTGVVSFESYFWTVASASLLKVLA